MTSLENKNILITGATRGLGHFLTQYLSGYYRKIYAVGRNTRSLQETFKNIEAIEVINCDFEDPASRETFYGKLNSLDINAIIHCLGGGFKLSEDLLSESQLLRLFNLNFFISAEINRLLIPKMKKAKQGWIIHVGSIASNEVTASVGYTSVKAIIPAYVKSLGRRLVVDGIFVSAIIPGGMEGFGGSMDRLAEVNPDTVSKFIASRRPTSKLSKVNAYGGWVKMLLGEEAELHASNSIILDEAESASII
jgi:short-subunit dehydrogenase